MGEFSTQIPKEPPTVLLLNVQMSFYDRTTSESARQTSLASPMSSVSTEPTLREAKATGLPVASFSLETEAVAGLASAVRLAQESPARFATSRTDIGAQSWEGDSILESEYLMLLWFLGHRLDDPRFEQGCRTLRRQQLTAGGWAIHPGGAADPSPSVKAILCAEVVR